MKISEARQFVFQFYYHEIFEKNFSYQTKEELNLALENFSKSISYPIEYKPYVENLLTTVNKEFKKIEELVVKQLENWSIDRVTLIDKSILYLGTCEIQFLNPKTPANIAINEYVEIAKTFGNEKSHAFINGILDKISKL